MRRGFWLVTVFLPLAGCVVGPDQGQGYGYAQPGYPAGGYGQAPGYPPPYGYGGPGYVEEGPPVFVGGEWGYYDRERHFRRDGNAERRRMEGRRGDERFRNDAGRQERENRPPPQQQGGGAFGNFHGPESRPSPAAAAPPPPRPAPPREEHRGGGGALGDFH